jgi:hypothetical protein
MGPSIAVSATATVEVTDINHAPVAANDAYLTIKDTPLIADAPGVLDNDSDDDGDPLVAVMDSPVASGTLVYSPSLSGTLLLGSDGGFTYTPTLGFCGVVTFTYHAHDGTTSSNIATVEITVCTVNEAPVAANDAYLTIKDTPLIADAPGVLDNDSDGDGDPLVAVMDSPVASGTLVYGPWISGTLLLDSDGGFVYTPTSDFSGVVTFTYHAHDGTTSSNIATVEITVSAQVIFLPITMRNHQS